MKQSDPYGLAAYGARLDGAKLHKKEKTLEVTIAATRLIDALEADKIAAVFKGAVPGCAVALRVYREDGESPLADRHAFF